jgi:hypothetical protein
VIVEIRVPGAMSFLEYLVDTIDPSIKNIGSIKWEEGYKIVQKIFKMAEVVLETGKYQDGILVKVLLSSPSLHTTADREENKNKNNKKIVVL